jgi:hypothetical protein
MFALWVLNCAKRGEIWKSLRDECTGRDSEARAGRRRTGVWRKCATTVSEPDDLKGKRSRADGRKGTRQDRHISLSWHVGKNGRSANLTASMHGLSESRTLRRKTLGE